MTFGIWGFSFAFSSVQINSESASPVAKMALKRSPFWLGLGCSSLNLYYLFALWFCLFLLFVSMFSSSAKAVRSDFLLLVFMSVVVFLLSIPTNLPSATAQWAVLSTYRDSMYHN